MTNTTKTKEKDMPKKISLIIILIVACICASIVLVGCSDDNGTAITIMLSNGEGYVVESPNLIENLQIGDSCSFRVRILDGYYFGSVSHGNFSNGILTIEDVRYGMSIKFSVYKIPTINIERTNCDVSVEIIESANEEHLSLGDTVKVTFSPHKYYEFAKLSYNGSDVALPDDKTQQFSYDVILQTQCDLQVACIGQEIQVTTSTIGDGKITTNAIDDKIRYGEELIVNCEGINGSSFVNALINDTYTKDKQTILLVSNIKIDIKAYFQGQDETLVSYDPNGGVATYDKIELIIEKNDNFYLLNAKQTPITKQGYALVGWRDAEGNTHSLGAMITSKDQPLTFFAVWEKQTDDSYFTYQTYENPEGIKGVEITGLSTIAKSNSIDKIVVPDKINGFDVVGIAQNAFSGLPNIATIVTKPNLNHIGNNAFANMPNLTHAILFDDTRYLQDDMFTGSENLSDFAMNSASLKVYEKVLETSVVDKISYVKNTSSKKIVTISGCSLARGIDSSIFLNDDVLQDYAIINTGVHAGYGVSYIMEAIQNDLNSGDIVVFSLENYNQTWLDDLPSYQSAAELREAGVGRLRCLESNWDLLREYDFRKNNGQRLLNNLGEWSNRRREFLDGNTPIYTGDINRYSSVNKNGDFSYFRANAIAGSISNTHPALFVNQQYLKGLTYYNAYADKLQSQGVKVYFIYPPFFRYDGYDDAGRVNERLTFEANLKLQATFKVLGSLDDVCQPEENMADWVNHLSTQGAKIYAKTYADLLKSAILEE